MREINAQLITDKVAGFALTPIAAFPAISESASRMQGKRTVGNGSGHTR